MSRILCRGYWQRQQICATPILQNVNRWVSLGGSSATTSSIETQHPSHASCLHTHTRTKDEASPSMLGQTTQLYNESRRQFTTSIRHASNESSGHEVKSNSSASNTNTHERASSRGIIITGGTSGIGFAVAQKAILEGATHVRLITRDSKRGEAAIERLRQTTSTPIDLDYIVANTKEYSDAKLFQTTNSNPNPFTTIIHCAGITQTSLLTSTRPEDISTLLSVNLESAALLAKSLLKRYMQSCMSRNRHQDALSQPRQSWQIVNISSLLAIKGGYGSSIYAASKAGLIALTRTVALEAAEVTARYGHVAPGFRANVVVPGYIETPMTKDISGSSREKLLQQIPAARFGTPQEVADAVMFLIGNEYANNCVLNLDGGLSAT